MFNILVVEDDKNLRKLIVTCLKRENYNTYEATNGIEALNVLDEQYIDLIVTDIMMPQMDGYELIRELREANYMMPILLVTAKSTLSDKKEGFLLGADDYMVKPIDIEELPLRIKIGKLTIDYNKLSVTRNGKEYHLAQKEFYLLYKLVSTPDTILTRQELIEEVWGLDSESDYRTVDVHIKRLREKLQGVNEIEIETIWGIGYKLVIKGENKC